MNLDRWTKILRGLAVGALVLSGAAGCTKQQFTLPSDQKTFGQKATYNNEVDVLWVIDTSSSMSKHQQLLADQAGLFIDALKDTGLNFHIGVTTMDMSGSGERGHLLAQAGTAVYLDASTPNLVPLFAERLQAGDLGSPTERGEEAMKVALSDPLMSGANTGFMRQDALLVVIFLSNEDDKSLTTDYGQFLDTIRPPTPYGDKSWLAHFMGVMPNDPSCQTAAWNYSSPGMRYIGLAELSGGVSESICDADLARAVTNVKKRVLEVITEFPLHDRVPVVGTIKVYVDGRLLVNNDIDGWTYNDKKNSIVFHGNGVPRPDSMIKIDFDPAHL